MLNLRKSADVGRSRVGSRLSSKKEGWRLCSAFWRMLKFDTSEFLLGAGGWLSRCCRSSLEECDVFASTACGVCGVWGNGAEG